MISGQPWFDRLEHRKETMKIMADHVLNDPRPVKYIIETGTARIEDNWGGDGQSTLVWDFLCSQDPGVRAISIDIDAANVETAQEQTKNVTYINNDSVLALSQLPDEVLQNVSLLYLDSFDWAPEISMDSAFHHISELATVWAKLPSGCLIAVDDRHGDLRGKHFMVEFFMEKHRINPVFKKYQIGWIKP